MRLVGHPEVIDEPWFAVRRASAPSTATSWTPTSPSGSRSATQDEVVRAFEEAEAAVAPIYDAADIVQDPQYAALESIITVPDEELGPIKMQNVLFRMLGTPGHVRWSGRRIGQDTESILTELGISTERIADLRTRGIV